MSTGPDTGLLLEREAQLDQIGRWLSDAAAGYGGMTALVAGAGLGKSTVLRAAAELGLAAGARVLTGRGSELEAGMPFGLVRQLFERELKRLSDADLATVTSGAAELGLAAVAPRADQPSADPNAVIHGIYWLAVNLAGLGPLMLVVDDVHWADEQSLRWLAYTAPRLADVPVFALVAGRPEPGPASLLDQLSADQAVTELELDPLDATSVATMLERGLDQAPEDAFRDACLNSTGGNPFFVSELVRVIGAAGIAPDAANVRLVPRLTSVEVARSIVARLRRLTEPAQRLADAVAVLDTDAEVRHACVLADLAIDEALTAADVLAGAEIFQPGRPLAFIHPIARTAAYEQLPPGERLRAHRRAAQLLSDDGAPAERIGVHAMACEPAGDTAVVTWLRDAARQALQTGAPETAARYLERALDEPPPPAERPEITYELGHALVGVDVAAAGERFAEVAATGPDSLRALANRWRAEALGFGGDPAGAVAAAEQALEFTAEVSDQRLLLEATRDFYALGWTGDPDRRARSERIQRKAADLIGSTPGERRALSVAAFDIARTGDAPAARAIEYAQRVRATLSTWLEADNGVETAAGIGESSIIADDPEALPRHERAVADAIRRGRFTNAGAASAQIAHIRFRLGDLREAEADARTAWQMVRGQTRGAVTFYWWALAQLIDILIALGELDEANELVSASGMVEVPREQLCTFPCPPLCPIVLGELLIAEGRNTEGIEQLLDAGSWLEDRGLSNPAVNPWRALITPALAHAGRLEQARSVSEAAVERARVFGSPWGLGMALRAAGTVADGTGLLEEAIEVLSAGGCRLELARARLALGAKLRRENQRARAREHLREALELAHRCGASPIAAAASEELAATGARPRRVMFTGVESLTASERRAARLAADGLSNPEIAQRLFVTRKTVEAHLGHAYMKLGINAREQLAAALADDAQDLLHPLR